MSEIGNEGAVPLAQTPPIKLESAGADESPMDFIQKNLAKRRAALNQNPGQAPHEPKEPAIRISEEAKTSQEADTEISLFAKTASTPPLPKKEEIPPPISEEESQKQPDSKPQSEPLLEDDGLEIPNAPVAENFKKLRAKARAESKARLELEAKLQEREAELESYKTGKVLPDALAEQAQRISQLERYEAIVNLKLSPAYQEKYVQPIQQIKSKLQEIANDYRIPPHVVEQLSQIENRAELNRELSRYFDDIGALEVKGLVENLRGIEHKMHEAQEEPEGAFKALQSEYQEKQAAERYHRLDKFEKISKNVWAKSLMKIKEEGKAHELILDPTNEDHNRKFVRPVLEKAAKEYASLVKALAQNGLENLDEDLAYGLAQMVQRAIGHSVAVETRDAAEKALRETKEKIRLRNNITRPSIGGGSSGGTVSAPTQQRMTPEAAAKIAIQAARK